jgi:hypothetical protein
VTVPDRPLQPPSGAAASEETEVAEEEAGGLPEAAERRLTGGAWSSGLSVADFASCVQMGMEPLGFVQGYAVMQWSWYSAYQRQAFYGGTRGAYYETYGCPHGGFIGPEHRGFGVNFEQGWVEDSWTRGWTLAYERMVEEAASLGAHGVIGIVDDMRHLGSTGLVEFVARGTAVTVPGARSLPTPFTTFLSGQRLAKLIEAGFVPVTVVAAFSSVQMYANCITLFQLRGGMAGPGWGGVQGVHSIAQVGKAQRAARHLARERVRRQLGGDSLHGAAIVQSEREAGEGAVVIDCLLRGTRVRRFADFEPLPPAQPVVRLS